METCSFKSKSRDNVGDGSNNNNNNNYNNNNNNNNNSNNNNYNNNKVKAKVVLMKKNILDCTDVAGSVIDRIYDALGKKVTIQLIASHQLEKPTESNVGEEARLEKWATSSPSLAAGESVFSATFDWDVTRIGIPGAFIIKNHHHNQFFLKTLTLEDVNGAGRVHFICNSWVYPVHRYGYDRIFFSNKTYLPHQTPESLRKYREQELVNLRGNGEGELKEWDRVYDYAYYNDLGNPDKRADLARPVLGGSEKYPYPRRGRTGRKPTNADPNSEKRLPLVSLNIYVPRDEQFDQLKFSDFLGYAVKAIAQVLRGEVPSLTDKTKNEFDSFEDVLKLYEEGVKSPSGSCKTTLRDCIPLEFVKELLRSDGERFSKFPMPDVIKVDKTAWRTDEEFGREMLAGINPVLISRLQEFPPASKLDQTIYGNQTSIITRKHVEGNMNGLTVDEAIRTNRLFILNHHDGLIPYLGRINSTSTKTYATRTILLLRDDGMLMPLAIELSLTHPQGDKHGAVSRVFTPADCGIEGSVWQLAKAYVAVNDSGYHQLVSHWLNTHAVIEPFIIATHRNLSVLHPIYKLLHPHFRDTMHINALARQILISAGGLLESTVFPARYAMEMSAVFYKDWIFTDQALPVDLLKRGVAVEDPTQPHGLRLLIEDYPYAVDGLEIWSAIETWVEEYCSFYYPSDDIVLNDEELQSWWAEFRNVGHGDKKHEPWWPRMVTKADLTQTCTIIIWTASALHAAVNFGQYPYAGYNPNRPTLSRRFMPEPGTIEYVELATNPDVAYLRTITPQLQTLLGVSLIEILSRHSSDEVYLGQRESSEWTTDDEPLAAFDRFGKRLMEIEKRIVEMNNDPRWKNRVGPVKVPYTLLYPNTSDLSKESGLTGRGIPNSVSI